MTIHSYRINTVPKDRPQKSYLGASSLTRWLPNPVHSLPSPSIAHYTPLRRIGHFKECIQPTPRIRRRERGWVYQPAPNVCKLDKRLLVRTVQTLLPCTHRSTYRITAIPGTFDEPMSHRINAHATLPLTRRGEGDGSALSKCTH